MFLLIAGSRSSEKFDCAAAAVRSDPIDRFWTDCPRLTPLANHRWSWQTGEDVSDSVLVLVDTIPARIKMSEAAPSQVETKRACGSGARGPNTITRQQGVSTRPSNECLDMDNLSWLSAYAASMFRVSLLSDLSMNYGAALPRRDRTQPHSWDLEVFHLCRLLSPLNSRYLILNLIFAKNHGLAMFRLSLTCNHSDAADSHTIRTSFIARCLRTAHWPPFDLAVIDNSCYERNTRLEYATRTQYPWMFLLADHIIHLTMQNNDIYENTHERVELAKEMLKLYKLPPSDVKHSEKFQTWARTSRVERACLLSSIPSLPEPSTRPLHLLSLLLDLPGPWPLLPLIQCYNRLSRNLPQEKHSPAFERLVRGTEEAVKRSYTSLGQLIICSEDDMDRPALRSTRPNDFISHRNLSNLVTSFVLPLELQPAAAPKPIVAIALPNSPLKAALTIAVATYYKAVPIDPTARPDEFQADIIQVGAHYVLTSAEEFERLQLADYYKTQQDTASLLLVEADGASDSIVLRGTDGHTFSLTTGWQPTPNQADDVAIIHLKGGIWGARELTPFSLHTLISQAVEAVHDWQLTPDDTCLGMTGIHSLGGLVWNALAPVVSGGSSICCPSFDANLFWDMIEEIQIQPTWYQASPSAHHVILEKGLFRTKSLPRKKIRLACVTEGDVAPSLERRLRATFQCVVLPGHDAERPIPSPPTSLFGDKCDDLKLDGPTPCQVDTPVLSKPTITTMPESDHSPYNKDGFINASHLDYLGDEGYLYVMGRGKGFINRGSQLISPFEIEKAIMSAATSTTSLISGRVADALAFSVAHDVLNEVPAVILVPSSSPDRPRVDIKTLHGALRHCLAQSKWPALIVYTNDLPRRNGKVLRIKLEERLALPVLTDKTPYLARHWEATCPPADAGLSTSIPASQCGIDKTAIISTMRSVVPGGFQACIRANQQDGYVEAFVAPKTFGTPPLTPDWVKHIRRLMFQSIHNYMVPNNVHLLSEPFPEDPLGTVDEDRLQEMMDRLHDAQKSSLTLSTEERIINAFAQVLSWDPGKIDAGTDFFSLGGDSVKANELLTALRADFNIHLPAGLVFNHGTVKAISTYIDATLPSSPDGSRSDPLPQGGCTETRSSTNKLLMAAQLLPLVVFYPMRRAFQWTVFLSFLSYTRFWPTNNIVYGRFFNLVLAITLAYIVVQIITPFLGIAAKWLIIGRYRPGLYPMWGSYHTRWWMVQKITTLCGSGFFNATDRLKTLYCRLMGAKVGRNVRLVGASLGEWDLLDIGDGVTLGTGSVCRPFAAEANTSMYLATIVVGENVAVGIGSVIAPGSVIPPNVCIGPNSSSWELRDADESNRDLLPSRAPGQHWALWFFLTLPILAIGWLFALIPWFCGLAGLIIEKPLYSKVPLRDILVWFPTSPTVGFHYLALVLRSLFSPVFLLVFTACAKKVLDLLLGELRPGPSQGRRNIDTWRMALMKTLLPESRLREATELFGQHHEVTSIALRMLGARIGQRVYWPSMGPSIGDYHLLDIGNDVVLGPQIRFITSDGSGSERICIRDGAMVDDRVCLLPGVEIGEKTMMGTATLARRGGVYPEGTYIGSRGGDCVSWLTGWQTAKKGKPLFPSHGQQMSNTDTLVAKKVLQHMNSSDTLVDVKRPSKQSTVDSNFDDIVPDQGHPRRDSPFDKAFYDKKAPYYVFGQTTIFLYSAFMSVFTAFYWNVPVICSIKLVGRIVHDHIQATETVFHDNAYFVLALYVLSTISMCILTTMQAILTVAVVIGAKWALLGRTVPGNYDWDKSPYCQRRQLFLIIERLIHRCYRMKGIPGLLTGTHWLVLYYRALGATIGDDCALFANGKPSFMFTEPDLIMLGDRVAMDDVNLRAHRDIRGKFDLERVEVGDRCVLRTGSSMLSGATMKSDSCLLEHTLIMGGDVVEKSWTMQGWPAERFSGNRVSLVDDLKPEVEGSRSNSDATLVSH
ncbi:hypothetical protein SODALDRAFT_375125 [Sodiomyces alkalinus F11]|uniref:Carrier domain-containing protein n=1 Tax=Sodiomyces alkalinus (strain CBS 110278 / VKM F-3762 / F11) TaxID=1314773 RepID=A0A3N2Q830_SODAK|nr:hypothetical protein SODALDRAFT_375125 [Sodiomyces alkalinus F11]ROT42876.1 hypothetical protein SODALDRAFT_375125 [Sodiomyces alkalinus F11]